MDHDDVGPPPRGSAGFLQRHLEAPGGNGVGFHEAVIEEIRHRGDAGAGEFRKVPVVVIAAPGLLGPRIGISGQRGQAGQHAGQGRQAADTERIEPPQRVHQRENDDGRADHGPAQIGEDRKQERRAIAVDHHHVDEVRGHLHDAVLELRQQDQHHDQGQRQRARQRRTPQQRDPEEVQEPPGQQKTEPRSEVVFGMQHQADRRQMGGCDGKQPPETDRGKACGGDGCRWTWNWRGRHGRDATLPGTAFGPWLAMTRRRTPQPEPATCHKNVGETS